LAEAPTRHPRWGHRTSLFQWHQPALYVYGLILLLTGLITIAEQGLYQDMSPSGWALSWMLMVIYGVPVFLLIYWLDLYEREPLSLLFGALLWGGVAAVTMSGIANMGWGLVLTQAAGPEFAARWAPALTAPWTEEILKASGVILIYLIARREIDDVMDGFVYGAVVGLGFAIVEDVFYFMAVFGGQTEGVLFGFFIRVIASGLYGHVLYTGLAGMGIAYFVSRHGERSFGNRLAVALGLFVVAVFGHFLWNSPLLDFFPEPPFEPLDYLQIMGATAVKGVPLLVFAALMIVLAHRREHRWLEAALADEVGREGLTAEEWRDLGTTKSRRRAVREAKGRGGPVAARQLKRLHRQQVNLAMVRTRVDDPEHPDLVRQRAYCAALREALRSLPGMHRDPVEAS